MPTRVQLLCAALKNWRMWLYKRDHVSGVLRYTIQGKRADNNYVVLGTPYRAMSLLVGQARRKRPTNFSSFALSHSDSTTPSCCQHKHIEASDSNQHGQWSSCRNHPEDTADSKATRYRCSLLNTPLDRIWLNCSREARRHSKSPTTASGSGLTAFYCE